MLAIADPEGGERGSSSSQNVKKLIFQPNSWLYKKQKKEGQQFDAFLNFPSLNGALDLPLDAGL